MSTEVRQRINRQLDEAELAGSCLVPSAEKDRKALLDRGLELIQPIFGLFTRRAVWRSLTPPQRTLSLMRGIAQSHPSWNFCGTSAAVAHGLPVTWSLLTHVEVATHSSGRSVPGIRMRRLSERHATMQNGLRLTTLWRTVFDCLVELNLPDALAIADAALRRTGMTASWLVDHLRRSYRGHRGLRRALEIAALADGRSESGGESIARATMHELGFATPQIQVWFEDPLEPGKWFRVDFAWLTNDGQLILAEMDGRAKSMLPEFTSGRDTARVLQDERLRESHLTALRPAIIRFNYDDVLDREKFERRLESYGVPRCEDQLQQLPECVSISCAIALFGWELSEITLCAA